MIDELVFSTDEDCDDAGHCTKKQTFTPAEIHVHEDWSQNKLYVCVMNSLPILVLTVKHCIGNSL